MKLGEQEIVLKIDQDGSSVSGEINPEKEKEKPDDDESTEDTKGDNEDSGAEDDEKEVNEKNSLDMKSLILVGSRLSGSFKSAETLHTFHLGCSTRYSMVPPSRAAA